MGNVFFPPEGGHTIAAISRFDVDLYLVNEHSSTSNRRPSFLPAIPDWQLSLT